MNTLRCPGSFTDVRRISQALAESGLRPVACRTKAECFAQAASALISDSLPPTATDQPAVGARRGFPRGFFIPGRIEVLGKHTDYAGGSSLVAAAERGFCLVVTPREDATVRMTDAARGETVEFLLSPDLIPPIGSWTNYPMTVARRLCRNFSGLQTGAEIAFSSDLPPAAGMSSSSALMVATFFALAEVNGLFEGTVPIFSQKKWDCPPSLPALGSQKKWDCPPLPAELHDPLRLAEYLGTVENGQSYGRLAGDRGVGTFGGSEDHTAMLCAEPGRLSRFAYCPTRREAALPCPAGCLFAVASSGVVAEKTGEAMEKYNRASRLASRLAEIWRSETGQSTPHLKAVLEQSPDAAGRLLQMVAKLPAADQRRPSVDGARSVPAAALQDRLAHFVAENETVIPAACEALRQGDLAEFGRQVDASQRAAEELLKNQIPETMFLAAEARKLGASAASAFGAGFGGSVWALVEEMQARPFLTAWSEAYRSAFPQAAARSEFFLTAAGPAAFRIVCKE